MDRSEEFQAKMRLLRKEYLANLSGVRDEFKQFLSDSSDSWLEKNGEVICSRLKTSVHNLAGTGATYGFKRISDAAIPLDKLLGNIQSTIPEGSITTNVIADLKLQASQLSDVLDEVLRAEIVDAVDSGVQAGEVQSSQELAGEPAQNILLIDDDNMFGKVVNLIMKQSGYSIVTAVTGAEALDQVKRLVPNLIFLDVNLPDIAGTMLLRQLKTVPELQKTPVVMLSAIEDMETVIDCLSHGACDYLTKPCDSRELLDKAKGVLSLTNYRILLADDDDMMTGVLHHVLNREGYQVNVCSNGHDAFEYVQKHHPDLVILDCMMPGLDGFAVLHKIRDTVETKGTLVIMLSALNQQDNIAKGLELGANDYICKPFDPVELLARVKKLLPMQKKLMDN